MQTKMEQGVRCQRASRVVTPHSTADPPPESLQRIERLREQLTSLVDLALPSDSTAQKGKQAAQGGDFDDDDDWNMYSDDEPVASTSQRRNHVVFTDDIDTGAWPSRRCSWSP